MRRRMMASIGAKTWVNPYITDGLIAMWAGEWNVGGGMHDANATVWTDLIGGNNAVIQGAITFGDKCARLRGGVANIDEVLDVNYIEAVFKHGGQSYAQYFKFANPSSKGKYIAVRSNSSVLFMQNGDNFPYDK